MKYSKTKIRYYIRNLILFIIGWYITRRTYLIIVIEYADTILYSDGNVKIICYWPARMHHFIVVIAWPTE